MTTRHRPRFDIDVLRELAGEKVFARGEAYYRDGQVEILAVEPGRVLAQVTGTEDYRTELKGNGEDVDGECSCPAWEDWGFCKHMVATALAANDLRADQPDGFGAFARIRDHLVARMAKLRSRGEHVAYVLALKERFGRRRNFMKLLE